MAGKFSRESVEAMKAMKAMKAGAFAGRPALKTQAAPRACTPLLEAPVADRRPAPMAASSTAKPTWRWKP